MAAVDRVRRRGSSPSTSRTLSDGPRGDARLCARFVSFFLVARDVNVDVARPSTPVSPPNAHASATRPSPPVPPLEEFITLIIHRTTLESSVAFAALFILWSLKVRFPGARGQGGHRVIITAFVIASKVLCDEHYSNAAWVIAGQSVFALQEINQMEREMCGYLEWRFKFDPVVLGEFEHNVRSFFSGPGPYPPVYLSYFVPSLFSSFEASSLDTPSSSRVRPSTSQYTPAVFAPDFVTPPIVPLASNNRPVVRSPFTSPKVSNSQPSQPDLRVGHNPPLPSTSMTPQPPENENISTTRSSIVYGNEHARVSSAPATSSLSSLSTDSEPRRLPFAHAVPCQW